MTKVTFLNNPFPNNKFLDSSKLKQFADDNLKFSANGRKVFKQVENTAGKGEIARYAGSNFSFSHIVFKGLVLQTLKNQGLFGRGLNIRLIYNSVEDIAGKLRK